MAGPLLGTSEPVSIRALNGKKPPIGSLVILLKRFFVPQQPDPNGGTPRKEQNTGSIRSKTKNRERKNGKNLKRTLRQRFRFIVHCSKIGLKVLGIGQNVGKKD